jgi:SNF2 family DNA or RNA helicase
MRPQWKPSTERQAIGRLHRRGQTREVTVMRLVAAGTVDEVAIDRQKTKVRYVIETMRDGGEMGRILNM